jgi:hypothetical protein
VCDVSTARCVIGTTSESGSSGGCAYGSNDTHIALWPLVLLWIRRRRAR